MQPRERITALRRIPELDGLRGIAVSLVLFHHFVIFSGMTREVALDKALFNLAASAWVGVDLFFVLSGFLITGILYDTKTTEGYFRNFYSRRALRIFPLYFGFLAFTLATAPVLLPEETSDRLIASQGWFWTYLSNIYIVVQDGWPEPAHLNHFWSLAIEEQFYLIWPLAVLALSRQRLIGLAVACMATALSLRILAPFGMSALASYVLLPTRMDALAAGALVALLVRGNKGFEVVRNGAAPGLIVSLLLLSALFTREWALWELDRLVVTVGYTLIAVSAACLIGVVVTSAGESWIRKALRISWLKKMGLYSYGLYVIHHSVWLGLKEAGLTAQSMPHIYGSSILGILLFSAVSMSLSLALALLSYRFWETPFLRLKERFSYRARPSSREQVKSWTSATKG